MKKILSVFAILIMVALVFTGCGDKAGSSTGGSSEGSGNDGGSGSPGNGDVVFMGTYTDTDPQDPFNCTITMTFRTNGVFVCHVSGILHGTSANLIMEQGTYTGDPNQDGIITCVTTHYMDTSNVDPSTTMTNTNCPLRAVDNPYTETYTISNGRFTYGRDTVLIRQ